MTPKEKCAIHGGDDKPVKLDPKSNQKVCRDCYMGHDLLQSQRQGVVPFSVWRVRNETVTPVSMFGRGVLVRAVTDEGDVLFHRDFGRGFEAVLVDSDFRETFEFCHMEGVVCPKCHSAPGKLKA